MKVALILPAFPHDDEISLPADVHLVRLLGERLDLHVFTLFHPAGRATFRSTNAVIHPVGPGRYRRKFANLLGDVAAEHRRSPFTAIHANRLFPGGLMAVVSGRLLRIPSVASIGGVELIDMPDIGYGGSRTRRARLVNGFVLGHAVRVTVPSSHIREQARRVRQRTDYVYAPLPVAMNLAEAATGYRQRRAGERMSAGPAIFSAGSLYPLKDQETVIRAFKIVQEQFPTATLTLAGGDPFGYRSRLSALTRELELNAAVTFLGEVPHRKMGEWYQRADLFLYASRHESQGLVVLEAAVHGLPVVSTAVGIVPELAPNAAVAVPVSDPVALSGAALKVLRDPDLAEKLSENAMQCVAEMFNDDAVVGRFLAMYAELVR